MPVRHLRPEPRTYVRGFRMRASIELALERHGAAEAAEVSLGGDLETAEALQVLRAGLRVEQDEVALPQALDQGDQGDLAGVALAVEHAFAEERAADADPVEPAAARPL